MIKKEINKIEANNEYIYKLYYNNIMEIEEESNDYKKNNQIDIEDESINEKDCWTVANAYFKQYGLVSQQINSFNFFISKDIQKIINENNTIIIKPDEDYAKKAKGEENTTYELIFEKADLMDCPQIKEDNIEARILYPYEARIRNIDYSSQLNAKIIFREKKNEKIKEKSFNVIIGKIPIMIKSNYCSLNFKYEINNNEKIKNLKEDLKLKEYECECEFDQGGYFIIGGGEKVIVAQERMATNFVYVSKNNEQNGFTWTAEIRSNVEGSNYAQIRFSIKINKRKLKRMEFGPLITAKIKYVKDDIPIAILFRALGIVNDKDIIDHIIFEDNNFALQELIRHSLEAIDIKEKNECLEYIGNRILSGEKTQKERINAAENVLTKYLLPHISTVTGNEYKKAYFIGYMINRLGNCYLGRAVEDDRDHYGKKRIDTSGVLLSSLFMHYFRQLRTKIETSLKKEIKKNKNKKSNNIMDIIDINKIIDVNIITKGMRTALATGNWTKDKIGQTIKSGVAQSLQRLTYLSTLSHLRRINTPLERSGKIIKPRQLHNTHWGMICPCETPEGKPCGLVKNLSLMTEISVGTPSKIIRKILDNNPNFEELDINPSQIKGKTKIFVNGGWIGNTSNAESIMNNLLEYRRKGIISKEISLVYNCLNKEIRIYTDAGRTIRPLFIVERYKNILRLNKQDIDDIKEENIKFDDLIKTGKIEYLDVEEEESSMIAMKVDDLIKKKSYCYSYTHCEIHPAMILGVSASIIPFPDHNQSPRNVYQSAMGKQAIGIYTSNFNIRMDTLAHILFYPQKPLVSTKSMEYLKFNNIPAGINSIVAIMCYTGYNQEDSIIMNQSSIDRGLFRSAFFRTYEGQAKIEAGVKKENLEKPPKNHRFVDKLDSEGMISPGTSVNGNDIIIGKTLEESNNSSDEKNKDKNPSKINASISIRNNESGIIESVMMTIDGEGYHMAKVKCRNIRIPEIGDKFASRHGQKGTIGMTYRQEDLPFSIEGITPDIIVNPHAIPSRMTIGHLIECLSSKVSAIKGLQSDATPFSNISVDTISKYLHELGYQKYGNEVLFNGFTGKKVDMLIFFGPTYYQKLRHMVVDKFYSRRKGPIQILTRQPTEGRSREGGLRFGEMERDCAISYGAASFLKERLFEVSDKYRVHVCNDCGIIAEANLITNKFRCSLCKKEGNNISQVYMPYSCKLLFQELMAMHIVPKMILGNLK